MRTRDPFGQALSALRKAVHDVIPPGQHLPITDIATHLRLSTSPVREALSRLCGEGLIEDRRGQGYFTRAAPTEEIIGLFQLEFAHVRLGIELTRTPSPPPGADDDFERWITELIAECDNDPLKESFERVSGRLVPIRALGRIDAVDATVRHDTIQAYYECWIAVAPSLSKRLRRLEPADVEYTGNTV